MSAAERAAELRAFYAALVTAKAGVAEGPVRAAFARVERERFCGPGPWQVMAAAGGYIETPSADPAYCYQDVVIALSPARGINNGEPSLHARCLAALDIRPGETIAHVGCGTGYYSALLAELCGPSGKVHAFEIERDLAEAARTNLTSYSQVDVAARSGSQGDFPACDVIYVNAGATEPLRLWLNALKPGGRLLFPLTPDEGLGGMLLVTHTGKAAFHARFICPAAFIPCMGARDSEAGKALSVAFARRDRAEVSSLRLSVVAGDSCWVAGKGWWLSRDE